MLGSASRWCDAMQISAMRCVQSPTPNYASNSDYEISIRNRLVKQAAWAYLQPMSSTYDPSGPHFLQHLWLNGGQSERTNSPQKASSMEEPTPVPPTPIPNPPPTSVETPPHLKTKKRPLDTDAQIPKIRAILRDIRPNVLQVLRTLDFQKCKAASEIQEQVKLLMELYKQMTPEALSAPKCDNVLEGQLSSGAPSEHLLPSGISGQKQQAETSEEGQNTGTYVVGGSAFGWNFITFSSMEPVYYGRTKESFRAQAANLTTV